MPRICAIRSVHLPGGATELARELRANPPKTSAHVWIAEEKARITMLRELVLDELGHDKHLSHIAAYWTARTG